MMKTLYRFLFHLFMVVGTVAGTQLYLRLPDYWKLCGTGLFICLVGFIAASIMFRFEEEQKRPE